MKFIYKSITWYECIFNKWNLKKKNDNPYNAGELSMIFRRAEKPTVMKMLWVMKNQS